MFPVRIRSTIGAMSFPQTRLRRLRRTESLRALVRETAIEPGNLIYLERQPLKGKQFAGSYGVQLGTGLFCRMRQHGIAASSQISSRRQQ
jgi:hypothetical protein